MQFSKVVNKQTGVGQATWCLLASAPVFWSMAKERIVEESWFATSNISRPTRAISRGVRPPVVTCWDVNGAPSSPREMTLTRPSTPIALLDAYANFPDGCTTKAAHVDLGREGGAFTEGG